MAAEFAEQYRKLLTDITGHASPKHGYPRRTIEAAEAQLGLSIPKSLRDYYLSIGRHELNQVHNRLLSPDALSVEQGRLVFMEENQKVLFWGVRSRTTAADPIVFQTTDPEDGEWVAETPCSQFLSGMLCWYAVNSMPHMGHSDPLDQEAARRLTKGWSPAGRSGVHAAFVRSGQVMCIEAVDGVVVRFGTRKLGDFRALKSELGIAVHET